MRSSFITFLALALLGACAATATEMRRAGDAYEQARYDAARVWLVDLEPRAPRMSPSMRAEYFYLRGMTEYRLGHRLDALHYLALARESLDGLGSTARVPEREALLESTLEELEPIGASYLPPDPEP